MYLAVYGQHGVEHPRYGALCCVGPVGRLGIYFWAALYLHVNTVVNTRITFPYLRVFTSPFHVINLSFYGMYANIEYKSTHFTLYFDPQNSVE